MKYFIGLDLGTSGVKAVLFDEKGQIVSDSICEYKLYIPQENYAEQDALEWKEGTILALNNLLIKANIDNKEILGLGISGQMHGLVLLDKNNNPLRKVIIWCDGRAVKQSEELNILFGEDNLIRITGNKALPALTASKLLWIKENEPDVFNNIAHIMLPKDYINYVLTGVYRSEPSDSSGTQLFDINKKDWSSEITSKLGINKDTLSKIIDSDEVVGNITEEISKLTGLPTSCIVCAGAGDQPAAALGNGVIKQGQSNCSLGSSGVIFLPISKPIGIKGSVLQTFCHCVKDTWTLMGVTQGCGISLTWIKNNYYPNDSYQKMNKDAKSVGIGANKTIFLPYLLGERSPILNHNARGILFGIKTNTNREVIARAVMEGVAYSIYHCYEYASNITGSLNEIYLAGGGAKSECLVDSLTDIFGEKTIKTNSVESGALGVAILASVSSGYYKSIEEAINNMISIVSYQEPVLSNKEEYLIYYQIYKDLYVSNKEMFEKLNKIK